MAHTTLQNLRLNFIEEFVRLRKAAIDQCRPKTIEGVEVNGKILGDMLKQLVDQVNSEAVPNIQNAWYEVVMTQYEELLS